MNKNMMRLFLSSMLIFISIACGKSIGSIDSFPIERFERIRLILVKHYISLPEYKGELEAIELTLENMSKIKNIPDKNDQDEITSFLTHEGIRSIKIRDTSCVSFELKRTSKFLIWYKAPFLIYHSPEKNPYGTQHPNAVECRLSPTKIYPHRVIYKKQMGSWLYVVTKDRLGTPA